MIKHKNSVSDLEDFGKFQIYQYILVCISFFMVSMIHMNYIFVAEDVNHRCLVPECEIENPSVNKPEWWPNDIDTRCSRPVFNKDINGTCTNETLFEISPCDKWIFENNNSIVAELDLGCQTWKASLVGTLHNAGMIVSMIITGWIADKIGRKPTIIICSVGGCIGLIKIFITNFYAYLAVEFLESVMASGLYTVGVVLLIEVGGDSKRVVTGVIFSYAVYFGEIAIAFIAWGLKYWKYMVIIIYSPLVLFIVYKKILRESYRWQILRGKIKEAKETLKLISKLNKMNLTTDEIDKIDAKDLRMFFNIEEQNEKESIRVIFKSKEILKRLAVTSCCFFTSSFLYFGSVIHVILLPGDKYVNFVLGSLICFPGDIIAFYTLNHLGRRVTLQYGYLLTAIFLTAQNYAPESMTWLKILLFMIGKIGVVICFTSIYTYSLELFPTSVRGSLLGWGNTAARIGSMLAPLTPLLMTHFYMLPSILFSCTAIVSALVLSFTPETKSLPMFDTIAQIEAFSLKSNEV